MTGLAAADSMTAVLQRAAAGDEVAFTRIVGAYHADMVRVAYGICGERDLALDAHVLLHRPAGSLEGLGDLRPGLPGHGRRG